MGSEQITGCFWREPNCCQCRDSGDVAVDDCRKLVIGRPEEGTDHRADVKAADLGKNAEDISRIKSPRGFVHNADFFGETFVVETAAAADDFRAGSAAERGQYAGAGGGVADAHFTHAKDIVTASFDRLNRFHAGQNRAERLVLGHGRLLGEIFGAVCDAAVDDLLGESCLAADVRADMLGHLRRIQSLRDRHFDANVDDQQIDAEVFCHRADPCQMSGKVDGL